MRRRGYQRVQGQSLMKMIDDGNLAKRFERYDDERLAGALAEIEGLPLSSFERRIVDDIKAEQTRRAALKARTATVDGAPD